MRKVFLASCSGSVEPRRSAGKRFAAWQADDRGLASASGRRSSRPNFDLQRLAAASRARREGSAQRAARRRHHLARQRRAPQLVHAVLGGAPSADDAQHLGLLGDGVRRRAAILGAKLAAPGPALRVDLRRRRLHHDAARAVRPRSSTTSRRSGWSGTTSRGPRSATSSTACSAGARSAPASTPARSANPTTPTSRRWRAATASKASRSSIRISSAMHLRHALAPRQALPARRARRRQDQAARHRHLAAAADAVQGADLRQARPKRGRPIDRHERSGCRTAAFRPVIRARGSGGRDLARRRTHASRFAIRIAAMWSAPRRSPRCSRSRRCARRRGRAHATQAAAMPGYERAALLRRVAALLIERARGHRRAHDARDRQGDQGCQGRDPPLAGDHPAVRGGGDPHRGRARAARRPRHGRGQARVPDALSRSASSPASRRSTRRSISPATRSRRRSRPATRSC